MFDQNLIIGLVVLAVAVMAIYMYAPKVRAMLMGREGFANGAAAAPAGAKKNAIPTPGANPSSGALAAATQGAVARAVQGAVKVPAPAAPAASGKTEGFADYLSGGGAADGLAPVPMAGAQKPAGCYPREQLAPSELLPMDTNSAWAQMNPAGSGDLQGKNFLSAGALVGVNTIGQSLRNANYQLRAEPPNPQMQVGPWQQSTIEPDLQRRPLE
jgi:hypothetical protein